MEKAKLFWGFFAKSKPVLTMTCLVAIICTAGYINKSYANVRNRMTLSPDSENTTQHNKTRFVISEDNDHDEWQTVKMRVTAYCPCPKCCGSYSDGITACGHKICQGDRFVAADKKYPFGTEIIVPGYKKSKAVKVLDRGGAIRENRLDVFFNTHQEALKWGVRFLDVKIRCQ